MGELRSMAVAAAEVSREAIRFGLDRVTPDATAVPDRAEAVSIPWLAAAIGVPASRIAGVSVVDEHHGTASRARLAIAYEGDGDVGPPTLFLKLSPRSLGGRLFMNVMGLGQRETLFYRHVAGELGTLAPRSYTSVFDTRRGRSAIVLEDLASGCDRMGDITTPCGADAASSVLDSLAEIHARFWDCSRFHRELAAFVPPERGAIAVMSSVLLRRALGATKGLVADVVPDSIRRRSMVLVERAPAIAAFWNRLSTTLTHGDTHLGNVFFRDGRAGLFDWQVVARGPAVHDVAYFLGASMDPEQRAACERDLLAGYGKRLAALGGPALPTGVLWDHYRAAVARFFIGAVITATFGDRLQRREIARTGLERAVTAVQELDTFDALARLAG